MGHLDECIRSSDAVTETAKGKEVSKLHMVRGKYYDFTGFKHPGGELVMRQSIGTDVTASVASHHFTNAPYQAMEQYEVNPKLVIGEIESCGYSFDEKGFFETLKRRVLEQLGGPGRTGVRAGPTAAYGVRVAVTLATYLATWSYCCFCDFWWPAILLCVLCRVVIAGIGHEAIHGRYIGQLWHLFDYVLGFPSDEWHNEHCLQHHPHCKRHDKDPDEILKPLRMNEKTPWLPIPHMFQVVLQFFMSIFVTTANYIDYHLVGRHQMIHATVSYFLTCMLPMISHPQGFLTGLSVFFLVVGTSNIITLHAFHVSHINENNSPANYDYKDGVDWGAHQVCTTSNWATSEWFSVTGMLELQIEHHLFPSLPYAQQRKIMPLVKATTEEFGLPYFEYNSLPHGILSHMGFLFALGIKDGPGPRSKGVGSKGLKAA